MHWVLVIQNVLQTHRNEVNKSAISFDIWTIRIYEYKLRLPLYIVKYSPYSDIRMATPCVTKINCNIGRISLNTPQAGVLRVNNWYIIQCSAIIQPRTENYPNDNKFTGQTPFRREPYCRHTMHVWDISVREFLFVYFPLNRHTIWKFSAILCQDVLCEYLICRLASAQLAIPYFEDKSREIELV